MTQALLLSALVVFAATSYSPKSRPGLNKLQAAQAEFNRGDFAAAQRWIDAAKAESTDDGTMAKVELLEGQLRAAQQDFAGAEESFASALEHDPESSLDPTKVAPEVVKVLEDVRGRLKGELHVKVDGPARVLVDGRAVGVAPSKTSVAVGRHAVEARSLDGKRSAAQPAVVRPNRATELELALTDVPPEPEATTTPTPTAKAEPATSGFTLPGLGKPLADVRMEFDPLQFGEGVAFEVGGGVESQFLRVTVHARVFPSFGLTPRGALFVPVAEQVRAYVALELPVLFLSQVAIGLGGEGGAEYLFNRWLSGYAEVGGRYFFLRPANYDQNRLVLQAGVRLRVP